MGGEGVGQNIKKNNSNLRYGSVLVGGDIRVVLGKNLFLKGFFKRGKIPLPRGQGFSSILQGSSSTIVN